MDYQSLWGYGVADYQQMFDLNLSQFKGKLLEFASGISSLNAEFHRNNQQCYSCDTVFQFDKTVLIEKASLWLDKTLENLQPSGEGNTSAWLALIEQRQSNVQNFFEDYSQGRQERRYLSTTTIPLPFEDYFFDMAVCAHHLFDDSVTLGLDAHIALIKELARVSKEVRLFPLINAQGEPSALLGPVLLALQQENYGVEVKSVIDSFDNQENALLKVWAYQCDL